jgi:hypothetical protein
MLGALLLLVFASTLSAQIVETGIITGIVKDNTGAVVIKANVTVRNTSTGLTTNTTTDSQGLFVSPPLNPGNYDIAVDVPGFSKVVEHIRLEVGQIRAPYLRPRVPLSAIFALSKPSGICPSTAETSMSFLTWARALYRRQPSPPAASLIRSSAAPPTSPSTALAPRKTALLWTALATRKTITA